MRARAHTHTHAEPLKYENALQCSTALPDPVVTALANRAARLCPDYRNPEQFHEDKSQLVADLRRLARRLGRVEAGRALRGNHD